MKLILGVFLFFFIALSQDQSNLGNLLNQSSTYRLGDGNVVTMNINLWGHVQKPGAYQIPITYGLVELISHAGGPSSSANLDDIKIVRRGNQVLRINLTRFIVSGDESVLKKLQPGDTIIIGGSLKNILSDVLGYLRDIALVITSIAIFRKN